MSIVGMAGQPLPAASDIDLVQASREGDDEAFEELYRRYHPRIAKFARGLLRDDGRAEDVVQEAFVSALGRMRASDSEIQFKPWIYEIARNKAIDVHRRAGRAQEVSFDIEGDLETPEALRLTDPRAPEASLMDKERFDNFRGALDELSDTHHRIILLRELEGLSYREIGDRMQLSSAAVESALFRARRKLEHEYRQLDTGRRCHLMRASIARLAEGVESGPDRRRIARHARRCWSCRRLSRQLGVEPIAPRPTLRGVGALLPLPDFLRRLGGHAQGAAPGHPAARDAMAAMGTSGWEAAAQGAQKTVVVLASVVAIGGGGATLGGVGPLALDPGRKAPEGSREASAPVPRASEVTREGSPGRQAARRAPAGETAPARARRGGGAQRGTGAAERDAAADGAAPPTPGPSVPSAPLSLPEVDGGRLLPPISGGGAPSLLERGASPVENRGSLPSVPPVPALPTDVTSAVGEVPRVAPDLPVGVPELGRALPLH